MRIDFDIWRPDVQDLNAGYARRLRNVIPRADGYGPFRDLSPFTQALPAACRGFFMARSPADGSVLVFAGTATKLYLLDNTTLTWADVSNGGGSYAALDADAQWSFAQFNNIVIASHRNVAMQRYTIGSSSAFSNLAGSPPQAGWIAVVARFLVAGDILNAPLRIQWSGLNDVANWTSGTGSADDQDFPDGGRVRAVIEAANDVGLILQENAVRRMIFAAGSDVIFQIQRLKADVGTVLPYSVCAAGGFVYFASTKGFAQMGPDGGIAFIGEEQVDRTFYGLHEANVQADILQLASDISTPHLVIGAADPKRNLILWGYRAQSGPDGRFNRGLVYHWTLKKWAPVEIEGEYIASLARPGLTLDALDAIAPGAATISGAADNGGGLIRLTVSSTSGWTTGDYKTISGVAGTTEANGTWPITVVDGTHIDLQGSTFTNAYVSGGVVGGSLDDMPFALDDVAVASLPAMAAVDPDHKLGFFTGDTLEAQIETSEQRTEARRMEINGMWPITDAPTAYGSTITRDSLSATPSENSEGTMDADGWVPLLDEGRLVRGRLRIPAGTVWSYATGVETGETGVRMAGQL